MQGFIELLRKQGYSSNTIETYQRALKRFDLFLKLNGFTEGKFDADKLISFLKAYYRSAKSLKTATSAIRVYLRTKGVNLTNFNFKDDTFREFRYISDEVFNGFKKAIDEIRREESRLAIRLMVLLGLNPRQIESLTGSSYIDSLPVPIVSGKRFKRLVIHRGLGENLKFIVSGLKPEERILNINADVLKVTFYNLKKKLNINLKVLDFRENYAYKLLKKGLPLSIVSEYSNVSVQRLSYIYRFSSLKSDIEIVGEKLKDL